VEDENNIDTNMDIANQMGDKQYISTADVEK